MRLLMIYLVLLFICVFTYNQVHSFQSQYYTCGRRTGFISDRLDSSYKTKPSLIITTLSLPSSSDETTSAAKAVYNNTNNILLEISKMSVTLVGMTTSLVVSGTFFIVLALKRDAIMVSFFIGSIVNAILSKILKRIINQTRPPELDEQSMSIKPSDGGMPSSHAMSLGFISTFTMLNLPWTQFPLIIYTIISLLYRVQVKLHTWQQVVVGSIIGSMNGYGWYHLCVGTNPWNINIMDIISKTLLDETGTLPLPMLLIPALIGAATVGSVERRISKFLKKNC